MHTFTPEDLLQYLYNETSSKKSYDIKAALETNWDLRQMFEAMISGKDQLEKIELSPRDEAIKKIMNYAEAALHQVHSH